MWFNIVFQLIRRARENLRLLTRDLESVTVQVDAAGKRFVYQVLDKRDKNHRDKYQPDDSQVMDVCMKDLRVPTVQLKLLNFIYLS